MALRSANASLLGLGIREERVRQAAGHVTPQFPQPGGVRLDTAWICRTQPSPARSLLPLAVTLHPTRLLRPNPLYGYPGSPRLLSLPCSAGHERTGNALLHWRRCHGGPAVPVSHQSRRYAWKELRLPHSHPSHCRLGGPALPRAKPCSQLVKLPGTRNSQLNEQLKKGRQPILDRGSQSRALSRASGPGEGGEQHPSALAPQSPKSELEEARDDRADPSGGTFH